MSSHAEVVVVGAGLAGLSAATRLAAAGLDVQVLEAGGRARAARAVLRALRPSLPHDRSAP